MGKYWAVKQPHTNMGTSEACTWPHVRGGVQGGDGSAPSDCGMKSGHFRTGDHIVSQCSVGPGVELSTPHRRGGAASSLSDLGYVLQALPYWGGLLGASAAFPIHLLSGLFGGAANQTRPRLRFIWLHLSSRAVH